MNIIDYVKKYGDKTFDEEPFNEIDNLVFSSIVFLDFRNIVENKRKYITLENAAKKYLGSRGNIHDDVINDIINLLEIIHDSNRYKNVLLYNYEFENNETQFSAITFRLPKNVVVAFKGTDETLTGWREDFEMAYKFPVKAHTLAINYLNRTIRFYDKNIIVVGHSKGGNLSLVSSMYCKSFIRWRIKKVYNNDGQGLRKKEIESKEFFKIREKYIHIIPNYSYVGVLLRSDIETEKIVRSNKKGLYAHHLFNWEVYNNELIETSLSSFSKNLRKSIIIWLDNHDDSKRKKIIDAIFDSLNECGVKTTYDFKNLNTSINIIKKMKKLDGETKTLAIDFIKFNIGYQVENRK